MRSIDNIKYKKKMQSLKSDDKDDPVKFINRNLELAEIWDEYDHDRKKLVS